MNAPDAPEEDNHLCQHSYRDMYGGDGADDRDPYKARMAFYCIKCLDIRVKVWNRRHYRLTTEFLEEFEEPEDSDNDQLASTSNG